MESKVQYGNNPPSYSTPESAQYPTTGSSQYPTPESAQYPTTGSSQYPTAPPVIASAPYPPQQYPPGHGATPYGQHGYPNNVESTPKQPQV